ncbi:MAG: 2-oxo acid dehydrogenase subunit E2 [Myxococcales bacterium]|nr:2-oxo acid dehydrogenase subunit E2 [Myxococcales bacterium]MCB9719135.1 2-oxo acid dehydrogenase subunit E2 [Myxococcales bacterium]
MADDLIGTYAIKRLSVHRQATIDAFDAVASGHRIMGLLELDVTTARERIEAMRQAGRRVSLFSFVASAIARTLAEHRALNSIRGGRRILEFEDVDLNLSVELPTPDGPIPQMVVVRRAQQKDAEQLYAEIDEAKRRHLQAGAASRESRWSHALMRGLGWLPRFVRLWAMRRVVGSPLAVKRWSGTTFVTSVGKFASIPGFVIPFAAGPMATSFTLGGVVDKPALREGALVERGYLSLTMTVSHDIVDGGPAARFAARLQQLVETADGLPSPDSAASA